MIDPTRGRSATRNVNGSVRRPRHDRCRQLEADAGTVLHFSRSKMKCTSSSVRRSA